MILFRQPLEIDFVPEPVNSLVAIGLWGVVVHRRGPPAPSLVVLRHPLDLFLQSRRQGGELCFRDVIFGVLFPYRSADVAHSHTSIVVYDRAPWAQFGDDDEVRDTW